MHSPDLLYTLIGRKMLDLPRLTDEDDVHPNGKMPFLDLYDKEAQLSKMVKEISNPFSTGNGGGVFEAHVQASFVALMLANGYAPCLPCRPISKVKLQAKHAGYQTDDLVIFTQDSTGANQSKLLAQIKHSIAITKKDLTFSEVINAAWIDFNNTDIFTKGTDSIALITGPLSSTDISDVRTILEWARNSEDSIDFKQKIELAKFSSASKKRKLEAFENALSKANGGDVSGNTTLDFLKHFHLLGYDLDIKAGVTLALLHTLIGQFSSTDVQSIWAKLILEVQSANQNAGSITRSSLPKELVSFFEHKKIEIIPSELIPQSIRKITNTGQNANEAAALVAVSLVGMWNESSAADVDIIKGIVNGL